MTTIRVTFACGCTVPLSASDAEPLCPVHQEHRVRRVRAPAPRIVAVDCDPARNLGPLVTRHAH